MWRSALSMKGGAMARNSVAAVLTRTAAGAAALISSAAHAQFSFSGLGFPPGLNRSTASGVTGDGTVVSANADNRGFRWTRASGFEELPALIGGLPSGTSDISTDGTVIVGGAQA